MGIGFRELVIILIIVVVLFGAKRVPSIMGDIAKGIRSFREGLKADDEKKPLPPPNDNTRNDV